MTLAFHVHISYNGPDVLCNQETLLSEETNFNFKKYNGLLEEGHTHIPVHGTVAIFIHVTIPYQKILLNIPLQAIAARIDIGRDVTIVSSYNSQSHVISENLLSTLILQISKTVILTGDFNSYNQIWTSRANDVRGNQV